MTIINSADLRNNLSDILESVSSKKAPVVVGRFGQPKVVLMDFITYNWQKQVIEMLKNIDKLSRSEIETLNILLDDKSRDSLLRGLDQAEKGDVTGLVEFLKA